MKHFFMYSSVHSFSFKKEYLQTNDIGMSNRCFTTTKVEQGGSECFSLAESLRGTCKALKPLIDLLMIRTVSVSLVIQNRLAKGGRLPIPARCTVTCGPISVLFIENEPLLASLLWPSHHSPPWLVAVGTNLGLIEVLRRKSLDG